MKYYIIVGEASGDLHASNLVREINNSDPQAEFRGWGGDLMKSQGVELVKHYKDIAYMGFIEVLRHLRKILKHIDFCKQDIMQFKPDVLILVDYPGFNLKIASFAKQNNIKVVYYISPQVWAWKESRVKSIKRDVDKMMVILPFEKDFYAKHNYPVEFVGHPLLDAIHQYNNNYNTSSFFEKNSLEEKPIIALLPGSRKQEIEKILNIMLSVIPEFSDYQFVIAGVNSISEEFYQQKIGNVPIKIIYGQTYNLLQNSYAAVVTSGTATLETALFKVPEVVCYKANAISMRIAKYFVNIKYISLVNLIMDKMVVKELIQQDCTKEKVKEELSLLLYNENYRLTMLDNFEKLATILGNKGASAKAAEIILKEIDKK